MIDRDDYDLQAVVCAICEEHFPDVVTTSTNIGEVCDDCYPEYAVDQLKECDCEGSEKDPLKYCEDCKQAQEYIDTTSEETNGR